MDEIKTALVKPVATTVPAPERLAFSAKEVCAMLGISDTTLWSLNARNLLVPLKVLRHRLYPRAVLEKFLAGTPARSTRAL